MNVTPVNLPTYGSAAIASPPANENTAKPVQPNPVQQVAEAAKPEGTGQFVDKKV